MATSFQIQQPGFVLKHKTKLKTWISQVIGREGLTPGEIVFVLTSDEAVLASNQQFLQHDTYTDIITFDYCEGKQVNGDILISLDRVKENAVKFGVSQGHELRRVMIHGVLHLCGYKDKSKRDAALMRNKEDEALKLISLPDGA